jgi:hypothetical protein
LERSHHDGTIPVHALYVRTNIAKPRVRAFVDFLIEKCAADPCGGMKAEASSDRKRAKRAAADI